MSFNFLQRNIESPISAVVLDPGSQGIFKNCFVRGNPINPTIGFFVKDADILIDSCKIHGHSKGGIIIDAAQKSIIIVIKNRLYENQGSHIEITGFKNKCLVEENII